jgi:hypothetical protein
MMSTKFGRSSARTARTTEALTSKAAAHFGAKQCEREIRAGGRDPDRQEGVEKKVMPAK